MREERSGNLHSSGEPPKVSVCVTTYNHEKYILECVLSILNQETNFPFEVLVGDDCSSDSTNIILKDLAAQFPGKLKILSHERNVGPTRNSMKLHGMAVGEYVAHVDGDDYVMPGKLQAQANVLDRDCTVSAVWHRVFTLSEDGRLFAPSRPSLSIFIDRVYLDVEMALSAGSFAASSSLMYRKSAIKLPSGSEEILDFYLAILLLREGRGVFLDERLGVYRVLRRSLSRKNGSVESKVRALFIKHLHDFGRDNPSYRPYIFCGLSITLFKILMLREKVPLGLLRMLGSNFSLRGFFRVPHAFWLAWSIRGPHLTND